MECAFLLSHFFLPPSFDAKKEKGRGGEDKEKERPKKPRSYCPEPVFGLHLPLPPPPSRPYK